MAYCNKCGSFVEDGAKFCGKCGAKLTPKPIPKSSIEDADFQDKKDKKSHGSQRETVYDGEIHKCPNCGATLASFVKNCPECGYELRDIFSDYSVREFSRNYANATSNSKKIDLIRTFIIPNTKEDILEFAILASSNIDESSYAASSSVSADGVSQRDIIDAWMAKFDQAQQKANLMLTDDPYLDKINKLYTDKKKELKNAKKISVGKRILGGVFENDFIRFAVPSIIGILLLSVILMGVEGSGAKKLEKQVKQIETCISEENYDAALTIAYSMSTSYSQSWSETRANLIGRIQELQAEKEGKNLHAEGYVQIPNQKLTGKQLSDVIAVFEAAGFKNITSEPVHSDLITEITNKLTETKGEVDEISVNGETKYSFGAWVPSDTSVIIRYFK